MLVTNIVKIYDAYRFGRVIPSSQTGSTADFNFCVPLVASYDPVFEIGFETSQAKPCFFGLNCRSYLSLTSQSEAT